MGRLFSLGVVGNWSRKGVMPMKWLGVRPDTSKPPTRRITERRGRDMLPVPSKPPTRRITQEFSMLYLPASSKPPTRRITIAARSSSSFTPSKPPTRRITVQRASARPRQASKPPTRRITRGFYKSISAFQQVTSEKTSETSLFLSICNYLILNLFFRQLFYEAKGKI